MKKIDWHAGFVSATMLEFIENEKDLEYDEEHYIANRAQRIDLLIIKNDRKAVIHNPIGKLFSRFNICEYKSPGQPLSYREFFKTLAYTSLYLGEAQQRYQKYSASEYTMTFVRESHPYSLFKLLESDGIEIVQALPGIYELRNHLPFRTQVIITKDLTGEYSSWLKCLTKHGTKDNLRWIVAKTRTLDEYNRSHARNVMSVFNSANRKLVKEQIKETDMYNSVNELFADEIKEKDAIISSQQSQLAKKDALIAKLQTKLEKYAKSANNVQKASRHKK